MTYKILNELMSLEQLNYVIGGVVYNLFRYRKNNKGSYDAEDIHFDGDEKQWKRLMNGEKVNNINAKITVGYLKGIRPEHLQGFLNKKRKAGYIIKAC